MKQCETNRYPDFGNAYTEMRTIFVIRCLAYGKLCAWLCYLKVDCGIWIEGFWIMQDSYLWNSTVFCQHHPLGSLIDNQCVFLKICTLSFGFVLFVPFFWGAILESLPRYHQFQCDTVSSGQEFLLGEGVGGILRLEAKRRVQRCCLCPNHAIHVRVGFSCWDWLDPRSAWMSCWM